MNDFNNVGAFHKKFGLPVAERYTVPHGISRELQQFRLRFLREELEELDKAYAEDSLPDIADALVDLVYVALGTAHLHGLPWEALFDEVQRSNMQKVRAQHVGDSKRGSIFDVVKPKGWQAPLIEEVLAEYGWNE
jgi:predicted HAD superfamily Cof-like phosphohydrolase